MPQGHDASAMRPASGQSQVADKSRTWPERGRGQFESVDCPWTVRVRCQCVTADCPGRCLYADAANSRTCLRTWTERGQGLFADVDSSRLWTVRCRIRDVDSPSPGHKSLFSRGHVASLPRLLCGHEDLPPGRGNACLILFMMKNTLPPPLQQFVAPLYHCAPTV